MSSNLKDFLKNNFVLVLGVALPVLLLAVLMVVQGLSRATVAPPQHKILYVGFDSYHGHTAYQFLVKNNRLRITYSYVNQRLPKPNTDTARLALYDASADKLTNYEIRPPSPQNGDIDDYKDKVVEIDVPAALGGMTFTDDLTAPDGYRFETAGRSSGFFPGFFGYRGERKHRIVKNGAAYVLPNLTGRHYYHRFVGWAIEAGDKEQAQ